MTERLPIIHRLWVQSLVPGVGGVWTHLQPSQYSGPTHHTARSLGEKREQERDQKERIPFLQDCFLLFVIVYEGVNAHCI